jgi:hypothetical protein
MHNRMASRPIKRFTPGGPIREGDEEEEKNTEWSTVVTRHAKKVDKRRKEAEEEKKAAGGSRFRFPVIPRIKAISRLPMANMAYRDDSTRHYVECIANTATDAEYEFTKDILSQYPPECKFFWVFIKHDNGSVSVHPDIGDVYLTPLAPSLLGSIVHMKVLGNGAVENKPGSRERKVSYAVLLPVLEDHL